MNTLSLAYAVLGTALGSPAADGHILDAMKPRPGGLGFGDVVRRSLAQDPRLDGARAEYRFVDARADTAYLAFVPRVDLSVGYNRLSRVALPDFSFGGMSADSPFPQILDSIRFAASVSIPISTYFVSTIHGYRAAKIGRQVGRAELDAQREATALRAIEAFLAAVRAEAARVVARTSVEVLSQKLEEEGRLFKAGFVSEAESTEVEARLALAKVSLERARGVRRVRVASVLRLLGLDDRPGQELWHKEELFGQARVKRPSVEGLVREARDRRPVLEVHRQAVRFQGQLRKFASGDLFPKLALDGRVEESNPNPRVFPQESVFHTTWEVGASLSWSPNDYVSGKDARRQANRGLQKARAALRGAEDALLLEAQERVSMHEVARGSIGAATQALKAAAKSFEARQQLVAAGESSARALLDSESDLRRAELQHIESFLDLRVAEVRLSHVAGRLIDDVEAGVLP